MVIDKPSNFNHEVLHFVFSHWLDLIMRAYEVPILVVVRTDFPESEDRGSLPRSGRFPHRHRLWHSN